MVDCHLQEYCTNLSAVQPDCGANAGNCQYRVVLSIANTTRAMELTLTVPTSYKVIVNRCEKMRKPICTVKLVYYIGGKCFAGVCVLASIH
jgi:hypothetical protein